MSSEPKTLIIFDTNKLRQVTDGEPSYGNFEFGSEYKEISTFITNSGLSGLVEIGVPEIAMRELIQQKVESYADDCEDLSAIKTRLTELMPAGSVRIEIPEQRVDCLAHLTPKLEAFIRESNVKVLKFPEDRLGDIFKGVLQRAVGKQPPFRQHNKASDVGFKDVVIWESILNYPLLSNYEKLIFVSGDTVFGRDCQLEFQRKINKEISIFISVKLLIVELEKVYEQLIEKNGYVEFTNTDYFKQHINDRLSNFSTFEETGSIWEKVGVESVIYFDSYEPPLKFKNDEDEEDPTIVISKAKIIITNHQSEKRINLLIKTYVDKNMEIEDSEIEIQND